MPDPVVCLLCLPVEWTGQRNFCENFGNGLKNRAFIIINLVIHVTKIIIENAQAYKERARVETLGKGSYGSIREFEGPEGSGNPPFRSGFSIGRAEVIAPGKDKMIRGANADMGVKTTSLLHPQDAIFTMRDIVLEALARSYLYYK